MAVEVGVAYVDIVPSAAGFANKIKAELGGLDQEASAAGAKAGEGFSSGFASKTAKLATGAALGIGAAATAAAGFGLTIAASNEQAQISFETMLGSADKATSFLTDLKDFAAKTPFEFPELQTAASSLIAIGVDASKVIPIMTTLGNVTSGMGTGSEGVQRATVALQQMNAAGKITAEDLNQLRDAGIPVFDLLAGATGKTKEELAGMAQNGKLGKQELDQLMSALESGKGLERFNGLMEKQSQSLSGLVATLKDTVGQGLANAMAPAVDTIKGQLPAISDALGSAIGAMGPALNSIIGSLSTAFQAILPVITPVIDVLGGVFATAVAGIAPIIQDLTPYFAQLVQLLGSDLAESMAELFPALRELFKAFAPLIPVLANLAGTIFRQLVAILVQLALALVPVVETLVKAMAPVIEALVPLLPQLVDAFMPLIPPLADLLLALTPLIAQMLTFTTQVLVKMLPYLIPLIEAFATFAATLIDDLVPAVKVVVGWMVDFSKAMTSLDFSKMGEMLSNLWSTVSTWFTGTALPKMGEWAAQLGSAFVSWAGTAIAALPGVLAAIGTWIVTTGIPALGRAALGLAGALVGWIGSAIGWLVPKLGEWLAAFGQWVANDALPWVLEKMASLAVGLLLWIIKAQIEMPPKLVEFLAAFGGWLFGTAIPWVNDKIAELTTAMLSFIVEAIKAAPSKLAEFATALIGFIAGLPDRISDAAKNMFVGIANSFLAALNWLIRTWNDFRLQIPEVEIMGQKVGGFTLDTPDLPQYGELRALARGGFLPANRPAIVGEAGPELWWPRNAGTVLPNAALSAAAHPGAGVVIENLTMVGVGGPAEAAFELRRELRRTAFFGGVTY